MAIKFKGIGHVALRCKDFGRMSDFYEKTLGLKKAFDLIDENDEAWIRYYRVAPGQFIELFPGVASCPNDGYVGDNRKCDRSHFHCCFETPARHEAIADLEGRKGVPVGRTPDDTVGLCRSYCQFVTDPEGNEWELMEFTPESLQIVNDTREGAQ